jgi:hypothetical protein
MRASIVRQSWYSIIRGDRVALGRSAANTLGAPEGAALPSGHAAVDVTAQSDSESDEEENTMRDVTTIKSLGQSYPFDQTTTKSSRDVEKLFDVPFERKPLFSIYFLEVCAEISVEAASVGRAYVINPHSIIASNRLARTST